MPEDAPGSNGTEPSVLTEPQPTETAVDYKALSEELAASNQKLEGDNRSLRGNQSKRGENDAVLLGINDRVTGMEKVMHAGFKAIAEGNADQLPAEMIRIQGETSQTQATSRFDRQHDVVLAELEASVLDTDGNAILDLRLAPELEDMRVAWNAALKVGDMSGLTQALAASYKVVAGVERGRHKQALAAKVTQDRVEKDASLDLTIPEGNPAGGISDEAFMKDRAGNPNYDMTREDHERYNKIRASI